MKELIDICKDAKTISSRLALLSSVEKNNLLLNIADSLEANSEYIISENKIDVLKAKENNMSEGLLDRLTLDAKRITSMANGIRKVVALKDPIGNVLSMEKHELGMMIGRKVVPLGVVGIIYESRPNVTSDAFSLCFKTGNAVILRGGSDCINSNIAIVKVIQDALRSNCDYSDAIQLIEDTSRETVTKFMKMNEYVDVLIPRGGAGLIKNVVENATIPSIHTGTGNCHIYIDKYADLQMATDIIINAKTQRLGVCNACESLVVHKDIAVNFIPQIYSALSEKCVTIYADAFSRSICPDMSEATEDDYYTEYLDRKISLITVSSIDEAITHINEHNTGHSESIITKDYDNANKFLNEIDAACVYVNASTRFTDGEQFGLGAEIGISTQKLHARGPMGLDALTTTKFIIYGNGQVRP